MTMKSSKNIKSLQKGKMVVFNYKKVEQLIEHSVQKKHYRIVGAYVDSVVKVLQHNLFLERANNPDSIKNIGDFLLALPRDFRMAAVQNLVLGDKNLARMLQKETRLFEKVKADLLSRK